MTDNDNNYLQINADTWDHRTSVHVDSDFYNVNGFLNGELSLNQLERELLGNVKGKSLLHLQCHFGLDTLSWARLGAAVTGVDLSSKAISQARDLATKANLSAKFINQDVYAFGEANSRQYDIVFTSYGVLCWLPDLSRWANVVAKALKQGGSLYLVEFHPFNDLLSGYSYFKQALPDVEDEGTYTENCPGTQKTTLTWPHPLSEVITALINAGLIIEHFEEHTFSPYNCFDGLTYVPGMGYQLKHKNQNVPLLYSVKATKPER